MNWIFGNASHHSPVSLDFTIPSVRKLKGQIRPFLKLSSSSSCIPSSESDTGIDLIIQGDSEYTFVEFKNTYSAGETTLIGNYATGKVCENMFLTCTYYPDDLYVRYMPSQVKIAIDHASSKIKSKRPYLSSVAITEALSHLYENMGYGYIYYHYDEVDTISLELSLEKSFYYFLSACEDTERLTCELDRNYQFRVARKASKALKSFKRDILRLKVVNQLMSNPVLPLIRSSITRQYGDDSDDEPRAINQALATIGGYNA